MAIRKRVNQQGVSWQVDYRDPEGKRIMKCFPKKADAEAYLGKVTVAKREERYHDVFDVKRETQVTFNELAEKYVENRAGEAALWFVNAAPRVFSVPRKLWIDAIRGSLAASDPAATRAVAASQVATDLDLDDPVAVVRLLNRQLAGERLDPVEVYETLEPIESVIIGDVDLCRRKLARYKEIGTDRLMCLMQFGRLPHARVLASLRTTGEALLPDFAS